MKRKVGKAPKPNSKRNKKDEDEEEAFVSRITNKTVKKLKEDYLKDDLLSINLLSKEELFKKIYDEAKPYFNLPRDVKLIILNFLELFVSKEVMDQMILYEEKRDRKQKSTRHINFIPYFYGHFYDLSTPFIVFKNIILDINIRKLFPGMYLNVLPFTNSSFSGKMDHIPLNNGKLYPGEISQKIFQKYVKNQRVEYRDLEDENQDIENIGVLEVIYKSEFDGFLPNVHTIIISKNSNLDKVFNQIDPIKIKKVVLNICNDEIINFLKNCSNIEEIEHTEKPGLGLIQYFENVKLKKVYIFMRYNSIPILGKSMRNIENLCYEFNSKTREKPILSLMHQDLNVENMKSFEIIFNGIKLLQKDIIEIFDICLTQNPSIQLFTDKELKTSYLKSHPNVKVNK